MTWSEVEDAIASILLLSLVGRARPRLTVEEARAIAREVIRTFQELRLTVVFSDD